MQPAFFSNRQALGFCAVVLLFLSSPAVLRLMGYPTREEVYRSVTKEAGMYPFLGRQIFEETQELDVAFVGSSLLLKGIDAPYFQIALSHALGRNANVILLAAYWQGMDLQYFLLRDLLEHRRVRMVVMSMPIPQFTSGRPHVQAYRWLRFGEDTDAIQGLPWLSRMTLYADAVLGAPRQFLSLLRPTWVDPRRTVSPSLGSEYDRAGYYGVPFVPDRLSPPHLAPEAMIYSGRTQAQFDFHGTPLAPYQEHWAREIGKLVRQHGVALTLLHVNDSEERGHTTVHERMFWPDVMGVSMTIIGVPTATLFSGVPDSRFYHFFYDQHMNINGKELFTAAVTPALIDAYVKTQH